MNITRICFRTEEEIVAWAEGDAIVPPIGATFGMKGLPDMSDLAGRTIEEEREYIVLNHKYTAEAQAYTLAGCEGPVVSVSGELEILLKRI